MENQLGKQYPSWFSPFGHRIISDLISQVFFPTNVDKLDLNDCFVLDMVAEHCKIAALKGVTINLIGSADYRGTAKYNMELGRRRAKSVKEYLDRKVGNSFSGYRSITDSIGEKYAGKDLPGDRVVHILSSHVTPRPPIQLETMIITGKYQGPLSNKFKIITYFGSSVSGIVGGRVISMKFINSRTTREATYTFTGAGPAAGLNFSFDLPSGKTEITIPGWIDVQHFEGNGKIISYTVALYGESALIFYGPRDRGMLKEPLIITTKGWSIGLGFQVDATGYWHIR